MEKLVERKLTKKDYFVVSSLLFALFFGAGNLIFPLHLGQLAGHNWLPATLGFFSNRCFVTIVISSSYRNHTF